MAQIKKRDEAPIPIVNLTIKCTLLYHKNNKNITRIFCAD